MLNTPLSNVQEELLKVYSTTISDDELIELKKILAEFFAKRAVEEADKIWDSNNLSDEVMDTWINE